MLLDFEGRVLCVSHRYNEGPLVSFICDSFLRISRKVQAIQLIEKCDKLVTLKSVVDWKDSDASLLQELNVSAWYIAWLSLNSTTYLCIDIVFSTCLIEVATKRFCEDSDHWPFLMVKNFGVAQFFLLCDHVILFGPIDPGFLEVGSARELRMFDSVNTFKKINGD